MRRTAILMMALLILLLALPAGAANTLTKSGNLLTYTSDGTGNDISLADNGATDAVTGYTVNYPNGAKINWILQVSAAAGNRALVRDRSITGNYLFSPPADVTGGGVIVPYFGKTFFPVFKHGEVPSGVVIQMLLDE